MPQDLGSFFTWLGSDAAIGAVISLIFVNWAWFNARSSGQKMVLLVLVSLAMGLGSHLLIAYVPSGVITDAQPYYKAIVSAMVVLFGSQAWHQIVNNRKPDPAPSASGTSSTTAQAGTGAPPAPAALGLSAGPVKQPEGAA